MASGSKKRKITGTISNLDVLDCSICCNSLKKPIYQCQFGHVVCKYCWLQLGFHCPTCRLPLGVNRCVVLERLLSQTVVRCPNFPFCEEDVTFTKLKKHVDEECVVSKCYCPNYRLCDQKGEPDWIVDHFLEDHWPNEKYKAYFEFDSPIKVDVISDGEVWFLFCWNSRVLFAYQCFKDEKGVWLDVTCIAPPASDVYQFSYVLSYTHKERKVTYGCSEMSKKVRVSYGYPNRSTALFIPKNQLETRDLDVKLRPPPLVILIRVLSKNLIIKNAKEREKWRDWFLNENIKNLSSPNVIGWFLYIYILI